MKKQIRSIVITICLLTTFLANAGAAANGRNCILMINSYSAFHNNSNGIIRLVVDSLSSAKDCEIYVSHMDAFQMNSLDELKRYETSLFREYSSKRPDIIVLLGNVSFTLCESLNRQWPGVPMILCGEKSFTGPAELIIGKQALKPEQRVSLETLKARMNVTLVQAGSFIDDNIKLMKRMLPQMNTFVYLGDGSWPCEQNDYEIREKLKQSKNNIKYLYFSSKDMSMDSLNTQLSLLEPSTTGVLYSYWRYGSVKAQNAAMATVAYRTISSFGLPIFSYRDDGISDGTGTVGGYILDNRSYTSKIISDIRKILGGTEARNIPFSHEKGVPTFNYAHLSRAGLDPSLCPEGSVLFDEPFSVWKDYGYYFIMGAVILVLACACVFIYRYNRIMAKEKLLKRKEDEARARKYNLIDNMPILYMCEELVKDEEGHVVETIYRDVNRHFINNFFAPQECVGKKGSELFPETMPQFLYFMNIALQKKTSITFLYYYEKIDKYYEVVINPSEDGTFMDVFCIDRSELHHTQIQLRSANKKLVMAFETANITPWRWDLGDNTIHCQISKSLGNSKRDPVNSGYDVSKTVQEYFDSIYEEDRELVRGQLDDLIESRQSKIIVEYRMPNEANGQKTIEWVEMQAAVESFDNNGKPQALIGSVQLITNRKKMEQQIVTAKEHAEEANRLKSAFLANMSHEIRTPLNAIVGFSQILATAESEEEKTEYLSIIENNNTLLLQLIGDILDLSKVEAGTMEFNYSDFDLNALMADLKDTCSMKMNANKPVELICKCGLPKCTIHSERNRLSQLIINMVTNSIKFTEQGSITFGYDKGEDDMLHFYVTDTGCGIEPDKIGKVFDRFAKLNGFIQGTGLGLAICKALVEHMGGQIGVESEPGKGSRFWFTLPYKPVAPIVNKAVKLAPVEVSTEKVNILIAEDNASNYKLVETILGKDYTLFHAWDGEEAVEMFKQCNPQIVLMDINMPKMNGYEATREIRKLSASVPIVALTAYAYASDVQRGHDAGMNAYMSKPINAKQLKETITSMMRRHFVLV